MNKSIRLLIFVLLFAACKSQNTKEEKSNASPLKENVKEQLQTEKVILFYGNSITAGYGLDLSEAFPAIIQRRLDSLNLNYKAINAGVSGETSAGGLGRLDWALKQKVDVFVLELGANDGLRGINLADTKKNLQQIIVKVKEKYPEVKIVLAGMEMPPSMGNDYVKEFRTMFKELAEENKIYFIPFLLEGVGGEPKLNLPDGIHPTVEGHKIVAENVWKVLKDILE